MNAPKILLLSHRISLNITPVIIQQAYPYDVYCINKWSLYQYKTLERNTKPITLNELNNILSQQHKAVLKNHIESDIEETRVLIRDLLDIQSNGEQLIKLL